MATKFIKDQLARQHTSARCSSQPPRPQPVLEASKVHCYIPPSLNETKGGGQTMYAGLFIACQALPLCRALRVRHAYAGTLCFCRSPSFADRQVLQIAKFCRSGFADRQVLQITWFCRSPGPWCSHQTRTFSPGITDHPGMSPGLADSSLRQGTCGNRRKQALV